MSNHWDFGGRSSGLLLAAGTSWVLSSGQSLPLGLSLAACRLWPEPGRTLGAPVEGSLLMA